MTAPTLMDMAYINKVRRAYVDEGLPFFGKVMSPGGKIRVIFHPTFVWYYDGDNSITFVAILFPDGTEWWPFE